VHHAYGVYPFSINTNIHSNQKAAEEPGQSLSNNELLARMHHLILGANIVCHAKHHQMMILNNIAFKECGQGCTIVDHYCYIFEANDENESLVLALLKRWIIILDGPFWTV
jgi:hypothetical protein